MFYLHSGSKFWRRCFRIADNANKLLVKKGTLKKKPKLSHVSKKGKFVALSSMLCFSRVILEDIVEEEGMMKKDLEKLVEMQKFLRNEKYYEDDFLHCCVEEVDEEEDEEEGGEEENEDE